MAEKSIRRYTLCWVGEVLLGHVHQFLRVWWAVVGRVVCLVECHMACRFELNCVKFFKSYSPIRRCKSKGYSSGGVARVDIV